MFTFRSDPFALKVELHAFISAGPSSGSAGSPRAEPPPQPSAVENHGPVCGSSLPSLSLLGCASVLCQHHCVLHTVAL